MSLELRPLQAALLDSLAEAFRAGHKNIMVCAPCGFGKTECATAILMKTYENGKRGAFVCDRISLVNQTSERFDKYGLEHGVLQGDHWRFRPSEQIQLCSIQTIKRRGWPERHLTICDEAHVLPESMRDMLKARSGFSIGLSATPVTPGLGKYFDVVINAATTNQLIAEKLLVPLRIFACVEPDMEGVKVVAGEFEEKETEKRALQVVGDVVAEYLKHGQGKKFIGFATTIAHAEELQRQFIANGINVATYTSTDKDEDRAEVVAEFRKPDSSIRGVLSVEALTRGFDVADVEVLILARPLRKSLAVHVQMLGRVMRTAGGKTEALVLDHSGNSARFWDQWQEMFENGVTELDDGKRKPKKEPKKKADAEMVKCPQCRALHLPRPFCPHCGHEYPKRKTVEHVPGTLTELLANGNRKALTDKLWPMVCNYARRHRYNDAAAKKMALALYKRMTGAWPTREFEDTPDAYVTAEVRKRIKALNDEYKASRQAPAAVEAGATA